MPQPQNPNGAGGRQRLSLSTFFAAALLLAALSVGWGQAAHVIMIRHGAAALPLPLSKYLNEHLEPAIANVNKPDSDVAALRKTARELQARADNPNACAALRAQAADAWQQHQQAAAGHYFDIDALTDQPPPFDNFPRQHDQAVLYVAPYLHKYKPQLAAELLKLQSPDLLPPQLDQPTADRLGRAALDKFGTLPWQISQRVSQLEQSFRSRNLDALPTELAVLAHFVADLHQPLHVTDNHDGKYTGNVGIHRCFEIDIINRYHEHFETATAQAVGRYQYIDDPLEAVFAAIARNYQLLPVIFDADSAARRQSGLTDQDVIYLKSLPFATGDALMLRTDRKSVV